jgi:ribosome maturation factor RimP
MKKCYTIDLKLSGMMISTHFIEVKMNLEKIKEKLIPIIDKVGLSVYSIKTKREYGEKIVEILLDTETMDIDVLEKIHIEFIETLSDDDLDPDYFLELSSLGAERPLSTKEELLKAVSKYIYLESPKYKGNGTLISFENDIILLEVNDKGRMKKIEIKFDDARKMRQAIKF